MQTKCLRNKNDSLSELDGFKLSGSVLQHFKNDRRHSGLKFRGAIHARLCDTKSFAKRQQSQHS